MRALSDKQLEALIKISRGEVRAAWGISKEVPWNTLCSLEEKGLIKLHSGGPHKVTVTPFGKQFLGGPF